MRLIPIVLGLVMLAAACGGSDDDSSSGASSKSSDPRTFAATYILTSANAFSGQKTAQDLINLYTPTCQKAASESDISAAIKMAQGMLPKVKGVKFEEADFGPKFEAAKTDAGYDVTIPGTKDVRLKIDGQWGNAHEQFVALGLEEPGEGEEPSTIAAELVDGKLLASDCDAIS